MEIINFMAIQQRIDTLHLHMWKSLQVVSQMLHFAIVCVPIYSITNLTLSIRIPFHTYALHVYVHMRAHKHTHALVQGTCTCTWHTHAHVHTHMHTHMRTHMHTYMHTHTHTHTHTHMHTHIHTQYFKITCSYN